MRAGCELRRISVFGPLGGAAVRAQQAPALGTPEGLQTPQSFLLGPSPRLAGPLDCTRILPPSSYLPPHGPAHSCAVAHSDRSFAAGAPADGPPRWATVSPPATALLQLQLQAPLRPPVEIASPWKAGLPLPGRWLRFGGGPGSTRAKGRGGRRPSSFVHGGSGSTPGPDRTHSGGKPPQSMRCRDSAWRLRTRAASGVRQRAGAVGPPHGYRRPTAPALSSKPVPSSTLLVVHPTTSTLRGPASSPARGWVNPKRRPRPEDRKAPFAELLPPQPRS